MVNVAETWLKNISPQIRTSMKSLIITIEEERERIRLSREISEETSRASRVNLNFENHYEYYFANNATDALVGKLDLSDFSNLEILRISHQYINKLILTNCTKLRVIEVADNYLKDIVFPHQAPLETIDLRNNAFESRNLTCFSQYLGLRFLHLGTDNIERIRSGVFNSWSGSLECLRGISLYELDINATDIDSGLQSLNMNQMISFTFGDMGRHDAKVKNLKELLNDHVQSTRGREVFIDMETWACISDGEEEVASAKKIEILVEWQRKCIMQGILIQSIRSNS